MEYYIMKKYNKTKEAIGVSNRELDKKVKMLIIGCFITMVLGWIELFITALLMTEKNWCVIGLGLIILAVLVLTYVECWDEKKNLEKYSESYENKLEILHNLLTKEYNIYSFDKIDELIGLYQRIINEKNEEKKKKMGIIIAAYTALGSVLSISFTNLEIIEIQFSEWLVIAITGAFTIGMFSITVYSDIFFDSIKKQYVVMIKDLEDVRFKYYISEKRCVNCTCEVAKKKSRNKSKNKRKQEKYM